MEKEGKQLVQTKMENVDNFPIVLGGVQCNNVLRTLSEVLVCKFIVHLPVKC